MYFVKLSRGSPLWRDGVRFFVFPSLAIARSFVYSRDGFNPADIDILSLSDFLSSLVFKEKENKV